MDEAVRSLEARVAAGDDAARLPLARQLERLGEPSRAARVLRHGRGEDALRELDRISRGGVDPESPWPCSRGDGRGSGRSSVAGPIRGEVVGKLAAPLSPYLVVRGDGSFVVQPGRLAPALLVEGVHRRLEGRGGTSHEIVTERGFVERDVPSSLVLSIGLGRVVETGWVRRSYAIRVRAFGAEKALFAVEVPRPADAFAVAPGAEGLAVSIDGPIATLVRFGIGDGRELARTRIPVEFPLPHFVPSEVLAASDGTAFVLAAGTIAAVARSGALLWRHATTAQTAVLAGAREHVLVTSTSRVLEARHVQDGRKIWTRGSGFLPHVDARGVPYLRVGDELWGLDAETSEPVFRFRVGAHPWRHAPVGEGRIAIVPERGEALVVE